MFCNWWRPSWSKNLWPMCTVVCVLWCVCVSTCINVTHGVWQFGRDMASIRYRKPSQPPHLVRSVWLDVLVAVSFMCIVALETCCLGYALLWLQCKNITVVGSRNSWRVGWPRHMNLISGRVHVMNIIKVAAGVSLVSTCFFLCLALCVLWVPAKDSPVMTHTAWLFLASGTCFLSCYHRWLPK